MSEPDKNQEEAQGAEEVSIKVPFAENFVYSNVSALSTSLMDIRISFGEALPDRRAYPRVGIVMPVEHAAQLVINLLHQLAFFEARFGAIKNPQWRAYQDQAEAEIAKAHADEIQKPPSE